MGRDEAGCPRPHPPASSQQPGPAAPVIFPSIQSNPQLHYYDDLNNSTLHIHIDDDDDDDDVDDPNQPLLPAAAPPFQKMPIFSIANPLITYEEAARR
jgi:hypothetical protein